MTGNDLADKLSIWNALKFMNADQHWSAGPLVLDSCGDVCAPRVGKAYACMFIWKALSSIGVMTTIEKLCKYDFLVRS